ncbi:MBL fold metallo-hydrolase [Larkinella sp. C7]|uniref:MBL fold metallo-hydrolase n=1 Tax=Larkinella sp. C7 TaxID=2576607 RepID=UPI001BB28C32|nr:MBL fold metallo-hydrolase [Larkinella sp. C7]
MKDDSITANELQHFLDNNRPVYILDVRPKEQREEWHIAESDHVDAYSALNNGDASVFDSMDLPDDRPIVTVCAAGRTSQLAADALRQKDHEVYSLEGGMKAWSTAWNTALIPTNNDHVTILQIRRTGKGCLSYMIASQGEALVIDASLDERVYFGLAYMHQWQIRYVLDTHLHADHLSRSRQLAQRTGARLLLPASDKFQFSYEPITEQTRLPLGTTTLRAIPTPGHTLESVCYLLNEDTLFTGDTLFVDSVGRPDLKAAPAELMQKASLLYQSVHRLLAFPAATQILPGHSSQPIPFDGQPILTTLGQLAHRLSWLALPESEFIDRILDHIPPTPPNYLTISELNQQGKFATIDPVEVEAGANHCAIR